MRLTFILYQDEIAMLIFGTSIDYAVPIEINILFSEVASVTG